MYDCDPTVEVKGDSSANYGKMPVGMQEISYSDQSSPGRDFPLLRQQDAHRCWAKAQNFQPKIYDPLT